MKVLYVDRYFKTRGRSFWAQNLRRISDSYYLNNRDGFFLASLKTQADVTVIHLEKLLKISPEQLGKYDIILFHHLCSFAPRRPGFGFLDEAVRGLAAKLTDIPKVLLMVTADAREMPSNNTLDLFDLVYKREHLKDLQRYDLNSRNRDKIRSTVLSCHLVPATVYNYNRINPADYGEQDVSKEYRYDLFFTGLDTSQERRDLVTFLKNSDIRFTGGIHQNSKPLPKEVVFERLAKKAFYQTIRLSRINLALEGFGQFTYRHWELWCLSAFMVSSPSLREIQLPFEIAEGEHYVAFDDFDDLIDKSRFYLDHPEERERIARNGRTLFENEYNFIKHGKSIRKELEKIQQ